MAEVTSGQLTVTFASHLPQETGMLFSIAAYIESTCCILENTSVLGALPERDASVLAVLIVLELREVLAIVANCFLCGRIIVRVADKAAPVGLALLVVHCLVLVQGAVPSFIVSRVVIIMLLIVKIEAISLAVGVLIRLIVKEPHFRLVLCWVSLVRIRTVCDAFMFRADRWVVMLGMPFSNAARPVIMLIVKAMRRGEIVALNCACGRLEGTLKRLTMVTDEVGGLKRADAILVGVIVAVHAALVLVGLQSPVM